MGNAFPQTGCNHFHPSASMPELRSRTGPDLAKYHSPRRFASLDGLRFLCIGAVLWHHAPVWQDDGLRLLTRGFVGVDFFFVLSGFLITTLLVRERRATGHISLKGFYWRRILRIIPVYFFVVTAVCVYYIFVKGERQYLEHAPYYYLFLSNFLSSDIPMLGATWSLAVEEQYYMLWPLLLVLLPARALLPVLAGLIALNLAAITNALTPLGITAVEAGPLVFKMFNATYAPILIGSALAILLDRPGSFDRMARLAGYRLAPLATFVILLLMLQVLPQDLRGWPNLLIHLTMAACLATLVVREDNLLRPLMTFPPIARVGEISYGIYLYHLLALHVVNVGLARADLQNLWVVTLLYSLLSIAIAEFSFRTWESWFLRLKDKRFGRVRAVEPATDPRLRER